MRSPIRAGLGSPRVETSQASSPKFGLGSPRADPSQRIGSPRVDRVSHYIPPTSKLGGSPKVSGSPKTSHGTLLVDVPTDKPGISLTGFASSYNIVAAVGKHHTTSAAVGKPPETNKFSDNLNNVPPATNENAQNLAE